MTYEQLTADVIMAALARLVERADTMPLEDGSNLDTAEAHAVLQAWEDRLRACPTCKRPMHRAWVNENFSLRQSDDTWVCVVCEE